MAHQVDKYWIEIAGARSPEVTWQENCVLGQDTLATAALAAHPGGGAGGLQYS